MRLFLTVYLSFYNICRRYLQFSTLWKALHRGQQEYKQQIGVENFYKAMNYRESPYYS